jgi:hypothetical protein
VNQSSFLVFSFDFAKVAFFEKKTNKKCCRNLTVCFNSHETVIFATISKQINVSASALTHRWQTFFGERS